MKTITTLCLALAILSTGAFAAPTQKFDDQGRLILQINDDGSINAYSYDDQGKRTANASNKGQTIQFGANGKSVVKKTKGDAK